MDPYDLIPTEYEMPEHADIANGIVKCNVFMFFGQKHYGEDTGNPMCSYNEFKLAGQKKKPIGWINMNGGEPPENPVVQMGLQGVIYKMWEQNDAIVEWVVGLAMKALRY